MRDTEEQVEDSGAARPLRRGWTTGTCATAAAAAAWQALLTGAFPDPVTVALPRGGAATLPLARAELRDGEAMAGIVKDAGDDPDVTHGALVTAYRCAGAGRRRGGVPRRRRGRHRHPGRSAGAAGRTGDQSRAAGHDHPGASAEIAAAHDVRADVVVTIAIPGGAALAQKTLNGRLGIVGGLSILGTTGIVVPFSCAAWIHSIHRGIDVARAAGLAHLAAATGSTSEAAVRASTACPTRR